MQKEAVMIYLNRMFRIYLVQNLNGKTLWYGLNLYITYYIILIRDFFDTHTHSIIMFYLNVQCLVRFNIRHQNE